MVFSCSTVSVTVFQDRFLLAIDGFCFCRLNTLLLASSEISQLLVIQGLSFLDKKGVLNVKFNILGNSAQLDRSSHALMVTVNLSVSDVRKRSRMAVSKNAIEC